MPGKSILITGCSSGIGLDAAETLAGRGWRVFATCRNERDCARLAEQGLESFRLDYEDETSVEDAVSEVLRRTGGTLDAVFNNGAYAIPGPLEDLPRAALRAQLEANVLGYHDLTRRVIPVMRAQGRGRIVNCSSVLGMVGAKWRGAYVASKFALEGMTDVLRLEMSDTPLKIILIEPGPIDTPFRQNAIRQFERWIDWEASARAEQYRTSLLDQLYKRGGPSPFELPPKAVTAKLVEALESTRPKPRYFVTKATYIANILRRVLPTRALDRIVARR